MHVASLPLPARYYPFEKLPYEVAPALRTFGMSFGNDTLDSKIFQFDTTFPEFHASKQACRADRLSKYYREHEHSLPVAAGIARLIVERLTTESPEHFILKTMPSGEAELNCLLTNERLRFDANMALMPGSGYESAYDALAMQVAEDLNVISVDTSGRNWLSAIHVCSPSTWKPEEKVGLDFMGIHSPVPTSEAMLRASKGIVNAMVHKGHYVRFNWGLTTNPQPNHYPDPPPGIDRATWRGKALKTIAEGTECYMWVERQIVWGRPDVQAALFTIRVSFVPLREIRETRAAAFLASLASMVPAIREYKGLDDCFDEITEWMSR